MSEGELWLGDRLRLGDWIGVVVPDKSELCVESYQLFSNLQSCSCGECYDACQQTCSGNGGDHGDCDSC